MSSVEKKGKINNREGRDDYAGLESNNQLNNNNSYQFAANYLNYTKKYLLLKYRWGSHSILVSDPAVLNHSLQA